MIPCHVTYKIDPVRIESFEVYAKAWIPLVERFGGTHHGYFLPHEGPNDLAFAAFSFPSPTRRQSHQVLLVRRVREVRH